MKPTANGDREVATAKRDAEAGAPAAGFVVTVVEGPDKGKSFPVDGTEATRVLVGQSSVCAIRLTDPHVSRRHAAFFRTDDELHLADLRSLNGTIVNGVRIADVCIRGGEIARVGDTTLRIDAAGAGTREALPEQDSFGRVVGSSAEMRRLYPILARIAASDVNVLIEGETGTGKEALAESIHEAGQRAAGPFVVLDCTSVPDNLLESELFGHERGAFTGAVASRKGVFEQAHGGTLFIDEIGELDATLQPKLLRALERSEVRPIGSDRWVSVDVRVIAATRRDLDREVQEGRFRDDLFFRLNVARVELPPLRRRQGDVQRLATHFWAAQGGGSEGIPYAVLRRFERHDWPGNVRELRNAVARQLALGDFADTGKTSNTLEPFAQVLSQDLPFPRARDIILARFERAYIERVLGQHSGSVARAAQASGIARRYFNTILARHVKR